MLKRQGQFDEAKAQLSLIALNLGAINPASIEAAMSGDTPALSTVRKYHGDETAKYAVKEIIAEAASMLNIGKNLQAHQIEFMADEVLRDWYFLTLAEIKYLMRQGITGKYGELYDRLDVAVVSGWFERYNEQRTAQAEGMRQKERAAELSSGNAKEMPAWFLDFSKTFQARYGDRAAHDFKPDAAFEAMVQQEWNEMQEADQPAFEQFLKLRTAQTKAMLKR